MQANYVNYLLARVINLSFGDQVESIPLENRLLEWHSLGAALNVWGSPLARNFRTVLHSADSRKCLSIFVDVAAIA